MKTMQKTMAAGLLAGVTMLFMTTTASAFTAKVPMGTSMQSVDGVGSTTVTIAGPKIMELQVYNHNGANNTILDQKDLGSKATAGPYSFVLEKNQNPTAEYGFTGGGFNFQHFVFQVSGAGKTCEVPRWSYMDGKECFNGCPEYTNFNPDTKSGIIIVPVYNLQTRKTEAEYTVYNNLTPLAQQAFMTMYNGGSMMRPIEVNK